MLQMVVRSFITVILVAPSASACDLCAISSTVEAEKSAQATDKPTGVFDSAAASSSSGNGNGVGVGILVESTHAGTLRNEGRETSGENQRLDSWVVEAMLGYRFTDRLGVRAYIPGIHREYRRKLSNETIEEGWLTGVGDIVVEVTGLAVRHIDSRSTRLLTLFVGVKAPTGDSDALGDDAVIAASSPSSGHVHSPAPATTSAHAIHGHDLALGTGSWDPIVGLSGFFRIGSCFASAHAQYVFRTTGDFSYRHGDEISWGGGPGVYLHRSTQRSIGLQLLCSGESMERDRIGGRTLHDTGGTTVYLGPGLSATWRDFLSAELGADFPILHREHGFQLTTDRRIHAGIGLTF